MSIWNEDVGKLIGKGLDQMAENMADSIEERSFAQRCLPVITFDYCLTWAMNMKKEYPQCAGFVAAVKQNPDPRNENDLLCVIIGMMDAQNKAISLDGKKGISTIIHGKTVDKKMLDYLNGNESAIYKF